MRLIDTVALQREIDAVTEAAKKNGTHEAADIVFVCLRHLAERTERELERIEAGTTRAGSPGAAADVGDLVKTSLEDVKAHFAKFTDTTPLTTYTKGKHNAITSMLTVVFGLSKAQQADIFGLQGQVGELETVTKDMRAMEYCGVHEAGREYKKNQVCSFNGSMWIARCATKQRPSDRDWTLCVKAGRDAPR